MTVRISGTNTTAAPGFQGGATDTGIRPGTNEIEFVTGGSVAATFNSSGNLAFPDGQGIDFSATGDGSGTMSSELLDDYEEGTWTPSWSVGSATNASGTYTKVGNVVYVTANLEGIDVNASTDQIQVQGLPYSIDISVDAQEVGNCYFRRIGTPDANATHLVPYVGSTGVFFIASQFNSSNWIVIGYDDITTTGDNNCILRFSICYRTS